MSSSTENSRSSGSSTSDRSESSSVSSSEEEAVIKLVELSDEQEIIVNGQIAVSLEYGVTSNTSAPGTGKSTMSVAEKQRLERLESLKLRKDGSLPKMLDTKQRDVKLIVIGPSALAPTKTVVKPGEEPTSPFQREAFAYGEDVLYVSYEALRGKVAKTRPTKKSKKVIYKSTAKHLVDKHGRNYSLPDVDEFTWAEEEEDIYGSKASSSSGDDSNGEDSRQIYQDLPGLVVRKDTLIKKGNKYMYVTEFAPTMEWMQFCYDNNVYVVADESHWGKNVKSSQSAALAAVFRAVRRAFAIKGEGAYISLNSATPLDKKQHTANYFSLIGLADPVENRDMFVGNDRRTSYQCYLEARNYKPKSYKGKKSDNCAFDIAYKGGIINKRGKEINSGTNNDVNFKLWMKCVMGTINFSMANTIIGQVYNGFFDVTHKEDIKLLNEAKEILNGLKNLKNSGSESGLSLVTSAATKSESAMVRTIGEDALDKLNRDSLCKVIIGYTRIDSVERTIKIFTDAGYGSYIVRVAGYEKDSDPSDTEKMLRAEEKKNGISMFQNSDKKRIIIGILSSIATGLGLHDLQGGRQRWAYMPGNPDITITQQFVGRPIRWGTRSVANCFICYPKMLSSFPQIINVFESNVKKSAVLKEALQARDTSNLTDEQKAIYESQIVQPGEYNRYIQLPCEEMSYLVDNPVYNSMTAEFWPVPGTFGYIGKNSKKGRAKYADTAKVIDYLQRMCARGVNPEDIEGFVFMGPYPSSFDPSLPLELTDTDGATDTDESD